MGNRVQRLSAVAMLAATSLTWAAGPRTSRSQTSATGVYSIHLVELAKDSCRIEIMEETKLATHIDRCLGTVDDLYFIANNGQRFWVVRSTPDKPKDARPNATAWASVVVASLYDRTGKLVRSVRLSQLVPPKSRSKVRQLDRHFLWLQGVAGVPGTMPRVNDQNEVALEPVDTKTVHLKF
jgi:hypothetical protein